ncbi:MAG: replicative DNA helicase [Spirochaetaceae bacterium]|jgi:replicative DNA helicase|nr:replicative DNA helicase [Spirochaetaceae bacterium]
MAQSSLKDRIPPQNEDAEKATLGALLLDEDAVVTAIQYLRADDFYSNANGRIFKAILNLFNSGRKADIITVVEELRQSGELDAAGGPAYVASLTNVVPTSANVDYYAGIVRDCSLRRSLIRVSGEISLKAYDESRDSRVVLEETQQRIFDLTEDRQTLSFKSTKDIIPQAIEVIENLYHSKREYTGIPSGFDELDTLTSGFQPAELIIIGARPSIGKTALALNMAAHITMARKIPAAFFTLEMSNIALVLRLISSEANIKSNVLRTGHLNSGEFQKLMEAAVKIYDAPLYIVDMPNMKLLDLRAQARRLRVQQKVEIIFIDYLTLITSENYQLARHEQVAEISRSLKSLARELNIPVVALSQVRREVEGKRDNSGPGLADLRESGSIEQDADLVMFLHREQAKKNDTPEADAIPTELNIAKQRNGPTGKVDIVFLKSYTKFASRSYRD